LAHEPTHHLIIEEIARAAGIANVSVVDPVKDREGLRRLLENALAGNGLSVIVVRRPCLLAAGKIREYTSVSAPAAKE
jgi:indolepyruvate ferredoxin oxidoreductase, alpha subunit